MIPMTYFVQAASVHADASLLQLFAHTGAPWATAAGCVSLEAMVGFPRTIPTRSGLRRVGQDGSDSSIFLASDALVSLEASAKEKEGAIAHLAAPPAPRTGFRCSPPPARYKSAPRKPPCLWIPIPYSYFYIPASIILSNID